MTGSRSGRHFLQIPGPTNVPERVLRALSRPTIATELGLDVDFVAGDWRHGVDPVSVEAKLASDPSRAIKAVAIVHNETSTGVTSRVAEVRRRMNSVGHPALLMVDTISSLASMEFCHAEWGVD